MVGQDCSSRESAESSPAASTTWGGLPGTSGDPDDILRARESACKRALGLRMEGAGCRACSFCSPCSPLHPLHPLCHSQPLHPLEPSASFAPHCSSCTVNAPCSPCTTPRQASPSHAPPSQAPCSDPRAPKAARSPEHHLQSTWDCKNESPRPEGGQGHPLGLLSPKHQLVQLSTRCGTSSPSQGRAAAPSCVSLDVSRGTSCSAPEEKALA